jgi:hypothetical protein
LQYSLADDYRRLLLRADEARAVAGQLRDAEAKRIMLQIADSQALLAQPAQARVEARASARADQPRPISTLSVP